MYDIGNPKHPVEMATRIWWARRYIFFLWNQRSDMYDDVNTSSSLKKSYKCLIVIYFIFYHQYNRILFPQGQTNHPNLTYKRYNIRTVPKDSITIDRFLLNHRDDELNQGHSILARLASYYQNTRAVLQELENRFIVSAKHKMFFAGLYE